MDALARLLVATDDSKLAELICAEAEAVGMEPIWEADGISAYEAVLEHEPHAVMLDANLPVHSGLELSSMLRADPAVPRELTIALLTDEALEPHALERAGLSNIFPKTHDAAMLREWVVRAVALRLL